MKEKLEKLFIVIVRKKWNGDKYYMLLKKSVQSLVMSFSVCDDCIYGLQVQDASTSELRSVLDIFKEYGL